MNPDPGYTWPVPAAADAARAVAGISGDLARGLPPKLDEALIFLAAVRAADADPGPDQPVPYTLTPKAQAALDHDIPDCRCGQDYCPVCADFTWSCQHCADAFFGAPPGDGLCPACRAGEPEP